MDEKVTLADSRDSSVIESLSSCCFVPSHISWTPPSWFLKDMRQSANMHHRAKFLADRSNHCRDMLIFQFFKMVDATILVFKILNF